jgi:hypothetical protein
MPNRLVAPASLCLLLSVCALAACAAPPPVQTRDRLAGAWELESRTVTRGTGDVVDDPVLGARPLGRLFYSASGHMGLQMMRQGRASAITAPADAAQPLSPRVALGYDAYFGTFTIDEAAGTITHHVEGSLFPEDPGRDFVRRFRLEGDTFELSFTSQGDDGAAISRTLVFRRSK